MISNQLHTEKSSFQPWTVGSFLPPENNCVTLNRKWVFPVYSQGWFDEGCHNQRKSLCERSKIKDTR